MSAIEMPKTYSEQLEELSVGESILIEDDKKSSWSTSISRIHSSPNSKMQFTIRTRNGESRVWRLKNLK